MRRALPVILFCLSIYSGLLGQQSGGVRRLSPHVSVITTNHTATGHARIVEVAERFTSVVVRIDSGDSFEGAFLVIDHHRFPLREDVHYEGEGKSSIQIITEDPSASVELIAPRVTGTAEVYLIDAPPLPRSGRAKRSAATDDCDEPKAVDQAEWRQGLPEPAYNRVFTETEHIIVHHSATYNSLTDYYNVVRNIYLYHTEVNGWSDIGYNYLVAPDGTIFKGRDPGSGPQDLVLGAHFCGRNSTTMGVCVMGDYRFVEPSEEAVTALESLLSWKSAKDSLDALAVKEHPLNPELPVIAGHRQGCATECPGDQLFEKLEAIRHIVAARVESCLDTLVAAQLIFYPNPATEDVFLEIPPGAEIDDVQIIDLSGQLQPVKLRNEGNDSYRLEVSHMNPGLYVVRVKLKDKDPEFKKVILL